VAIAEGQEVRVEKGGASILLSTSVSAREQWTILAVNEIGADEMSEAVVERWTGEGSSCCFEYFLLAATRQRIEQYDRFALGESRIEDVVDLTEDGIPEIVIRDYRLTGFPDLQLADSPVIPLMLCRSTARLSVDCTSRFLQRLQASADEFQSKMRAAAVRTSALGGQQEQAIAEARSAALGVFACYARMNLEQSEMDAVFVRMAATCPDCLAWIGRRLDEVQSRFNQSPLRRTQPVRAVSERPPTPNPLRDRSAQGAA
jgi:hypothetical protein